MRTTTLSLIAALLIGSAAVAPQIASAQVNVQVSIGSQPPPPRYERVPAARKGYVWAPGYWTWNGRAHVWHGGHWERARVGYAYRPASWYQDGRGWHLREARWERNRRDYERRHDHRHGRDDYHCPPGQAKKGHC